MAGVPVVIVESGGLPVKQVDSGAPLMTVAENGLGVAVTLSDRGPAFVVSGGATPSAKPILVPDAEALTVSVTNAATFTGGLELFVEGVSQGAVTSPFSIAAHVGKDFYVKGTETGKSATASDTFFVPSLPTSIEGFDFTANNGTYLTGYMSMAGFAGGNHAGLAPFFTLAGIGTYAFRANGYNSFALGGAGNVYPIDVLKCQSGSLQCTVNMAVSDFQGSTYYQRTLGAKQERHVTVPLDSLGETELVPLVIAGESEPNPTGSADYSRDLTMSITKTKVYIQRNGFGDTTKFSVEHGAAGNAVFSIKLDKDTEIFRLYCNGAELPDFGEYVRGVGAPVNSPSGATLDLTNARPGFRYKYSADGISVGQNTPLALADNYYTPVPYAVELSNISFNRGIYTFDVAGPADMTTGRKALLGADFKRLTAWETFACVAGVATGETISDLGGVAGAHYVVVENAADHSEMGIERVEATPYQSGNSLMMLNNSDLLRESPPTNLLHMFTLSGAAYDDPSIIGLTDDGRPTIMPVGGFNLIADYPWPDDPASPIYGVYDIDKVSGLNVSDTGDSHFVISGSTLTISHGVDNPAIHLSGSLPADPDDLYLRITKQGLTPEQKACFYRPAVMGYISRFDGYRHLFTMLAWPENPQPLASTYQRSDTVFSHRVRNGAAPCPAIILDQVQGNDKPIMFNIPYYWTPQLLRDYMTVLLTSCGSVIDIRYSNEVEWNNNICSHHMARTTRNFTACSRAPVEGEYVIGAWSNYKAYVCDWHIKSGSVGASNAAGYFLLIDGYDYTSTGFSNGEPISICDADGNVLYPGIATYSNTNEGSNKRLARRTRWMIDLIKALPDYDPARFIFGGEKQFADGDFIANFEELYDEEGVGAELGSLSSAPYGNGPALGWTDPYVSQANKAKVSTDLPAWIAAIKAGGLAAVADVIATWKAQSDAVAALLVRKGRDQNAIAYGTYEASPQAETRCTYPSIYFTSGKGTNPAGTITDFAYKGRTSGLRIRLAGPVLPTITSGSFAGNNAVGHFHGVDYNYNSATRYPVSGEIFDRVDKDDESIVLELAAFVAADTTNMNWDATVAFANYLKSGDFGDVWEAYIDGLRQSGHHGLFAAGGDAEGDNLTALARGFGWWTTGSYDDLTGDLYTKITDKIAATA